LTLSLELSAAGLLTHSFTYEADKAAATLAALVLLLEALELKIKLY